jgi:hypothetical protein
VYDGVEIAGTKHTVVRQIGNPVQGGEEDAFNFDNYHKNRTYYLKRKELDEIIGPLLGEEAFIP